MAATSRFIIHRKDIAVDEAVIESEGLTIGRLIGNDLVLNHRSVSRTHAGIKEINGEYWLFNLSTSNGTMLNGELVDKTPIADGDVVQIGRYLLQMRYTGDGLLITVEMEMESHPIEGRTSLLQAPAADSGGATMLLSAIPKPGKETITPGGTRRLSGTMLLTGMLPGLDEQALKVFWDKRKREAGKIAEKGPLHPKSDRRVGKAQFNWRPTLDLRRPWRKSYFAWGAVIVFLLSITALFVYDEAYSPGEISNVHSLSAMTEDMKARNIAVRANGASCSECHGATGRLQNRCVSCHTTQASGGSPAFSPDISKAHTEAGIGCVSCHGEHQGADFRPGHIGSAMCVSCHNDTYKFRGRILGAPHGGSVGYPVVNGKWEWRGLVESDWQKKKLPDTAAKYSPLEQFHLIHLSGKQEGRANCTDCHAAGLQTREGLHESPRAACASCHAMTFTTANLKTVGPDCVSCHVQHGENKDFIASLRAAGPDMRARAHNVPPGVIGGAAVRQDETGARWRFSSGNLGALPWYGWVGIIGALPVLGLTVIVADTIRRKSFLKTVQVEVKEDEVEKASTRFLDLAKLKAEGPAYPHPVVDPLLCIGCHACVEACPHDVLAIVNGVSTPVALDQCMEDTSCTVECPTSPKACIVINTTKVIPPRKVPRRDKRFMTDVPGIYLVGDVSGVPLIKNALNEGAQVIDYIIEDLSKEGSNPKAEYDVAIIGVGPAGLSATSIAKQRGLRYIAIEQDKVVSTIQNYPAGKYVFFKPDTVDAKGGIPLAGVGGQREELLKSWMETMMQHGLVINEEESCKDIKREDGIFAVITEKGRAKEKMTYRARKVILAIGNRGTPMKLRVPGEDLKIMVQPDPSQATSCPRCGAPRREGKRFCNKCGAQLPVASAQPFEDSKVKYKLSNPDDYVNKKCIVVGAGNSAIECAVDLTGFKREGDKITFTRNNEVTLIIRSDFKGDLKLGNKINVYDCIDEGRIKVFFRTEIKEIREKEVVLMDTRTKEERATIPNDYIFALIGGDKPTKFLEGLGIKIG